MSFCAMWEDKKKRVSSHEMHLSPFPVSKPMEQSIRELDNLDGYQVYIRDAGTTFHIHVCRARYAKHGQWCFFCHTSARAFLLTHD